MLLYGIYTEPRRHGYRTEKKRVNMLDNAAELHRKGNMLKGCSVVAAEADTAQAAPESGADAASSAGAVPAAGGG